MSITCYVTVSGSQCCAIHLSKLKGSDGADVFVVFAISIYMSSASPFAETHSSAKPALCDVTEGTAEMIQTCGSSDKAST